MNEADLRRRVKEVRTTAVDYGILAREVLAKKAKLGLLDGIEKDVLRELLADWEERLKNMILSRSIDELERLGKLEELEQVLASDIDQDAYLSYAIPDYPDWLRRTIEEVKVRL